MFDRYYYDFQVETKGLSGPIEFKEGKRTQFKLDLLKLKQHSLVKVGEWSPAGGVNISDNAAFFDSGTMNVTLIVITILVSETILHLHSIIFFPEISVNYPLSAYQITTFRIYYIQ